MATTKSMEDRRSYAGPSIFERGYRPFFFIAGLWGIVPLTLWIAIYFGWMEINTGLDPMTWHAREMLFGYAGSAMIGFALTAIPNWTGRLPVRGIPLMLLAMVWLTARLLSLSSLFYPLGLYALVGDALFFTLFAALVFREILMGKNWRNLPIVILLSLIGTMAVVAHGEALGWIEPPFNILKVALGLFILLLSLIGGRIVPSFTRNWLKQQGEQNLPPIMTKFDLVSLLLTLASIGVWVALPFDGPIVTALFGFTGLLSLIRLMRWQGLKAMAEPMVFVLHVAFAWIPIGFFMLALANMGLVAENIALHAWTTGAIGTMTLGVMTRASLGHSGRPLKANWMLTTIYSMMVGAAIVRVFGGFIVEDGQLLYLAALLWVGAFLLYLWQFTPIFFRAKLNVLKNR